ncbi:MAG: DUF58 domain-containing protein [Lachnospiraceae bacterium]|nr:DUF58 domain-containing protein [Lachnospiraceae bacterium]
MRLLIVLLVGLILYIVQAIVYKKYWHEGLDVNIDFEDQIVREGDKNALILTIVNDKLLPLPVILLKFSITRTFIFPKERNSAVTDNYYRKEYFSCRAYQKITRKYGFTTSKRGEYSISSIDLICKDIFMDKSRFADSRKYASVLVLPSRIPMEKIPEDIIKFSGDIVRRIKINEDPFEFNSIREYQPFDPFNHINWKATAKNDYLQVNTFNSTNKKNLVILLNLDMNTVRNSEALSEWSIRIASCLADYFISDQTPVALYTNGTDYLSDELIGVEAGSDQGHTRNIDVALARIKIKDKYPSFLDLMDEKISTDSEDEYIIVSNYRKNDFVNKFDDLRNSGIKVSLIIPEFGYSSIEPFISNGTDVYKWEVINEF